MENEAEELKRGVETLGYSITPSQATSLLAYLEALDHTNRSFNLTRIPREQFVSLHLLDSLTALAGIPDREGLRILDVGTGAGFPGVPLAALLPRCSVTLLDSTGKKVRFAETTAHESGISNVRGVHDRAENLARSPEHREGYDVVVSRAVAAFPKLMEWLLPLTKVGGIALAMKGSGYDDELPGSAAILRRLGGAIERVIDTPLPGSDIVRHLIVVRKIRQ